MFVVCVFPGNYPTRLSNCWTGYLQLFTAFSYTPFLFCHVGSNVPTFISEVSNVNPPLFLASLPKILTILLIFSKNQLLFLLILCIVFLYFIHSTQIFIFFNLLALSLEFRTLPLPSFPAKAVPENLLEMRVWELLR